MHIYMCVCAACTCTHISLCLHLSGGTWQQTTQDALPMNGMKCSLCITSAGRTCLKKKRKKEICKFDSVHLRTPCETKFRLIKKYHLQTVFCGYCRQYLELTGNSILTPSHSLLPNVEHTDPKLPTLLHPGVGFCTPQVINAFSSCLKGVPEPSLKQFILY